MIDFEIYLKDHSDFPTIDEIKFPNTHSDYYWSSTQYPGHIAYAWGVNFHFGCISGPDKTTVYVETYISYVRCVRSVI